ncbi:MAG: DnaD domain protein [Bacilli bacterium]
MLEKVEDLLKSGNYIIPKLLINNFRDINLSAQQTLLLIYLINNDKLFNPKKISEDLSWSLNEILEEINDLTSKGLLTIDLVKNNNIHEEYINLDSFYSKLAFLVVNDKPKTVDNKNLFDSFEEEFGRTLSPMEYEIINSWKDSGFSDELIFCALKEAIFNGVSNLRYIDKILYEWRKKGYATKADVEKGKKAFKKKDTPNQEVFEYDWLNEND